MSLGIPCRQKMVYNRLAVLRAEGSSCSGTKWAADGKAGHKIYRKMGQWTKKRNGLMSADMDGVLRFLECDGFQGGRKTWR